jgi:fructose-1,6-bisphosphatase/inositol monophosphatase family enzyme
MIRLDAVADMLIDAAQAHVLPRFQKLQLGDIHEKSPGDFVTEADLAVEKALSPQLMALVPGSMVVGEEDAAKDPKVIERLSGDAPVWIIDPIDGTQNFIDGRDSFGIMVALYQGGKTRASWIYQPVPDLMLIARHGEGTSLNGTPLRSNVHSVDMTSLRIAQGTKFFQAPYLDVPPRIERHFPESQPITCSAVDYASVAQGTTDAVIFGRLLPWDHAPGILAVIEAGGYAAYLSGAAYRADGPIYDGLVAARSREIFDYVTTRMLTD